jgi:hypothetical protein
MRLCEVATCGSSTGRRARQGLEWEDGVLVWQLLLWRGSSEALR